jgi:hypothetical protein
VTGQCVAKAVAYVLQSVHSVTQRQLMRLVGLDCIGLYWIMLDCIGLYWTGLDYVGLDWIILDWTGLDYNVLKWIILDCT